MVITDRYSDKAIRSKIATGYLHGHYRHGGNNKKKLQESAINNTPILFVSALC